MLEPRVTLVFRLKLTKLLGRCMEPTVEVLLEAAEAVYTVVLSHANCQACLVILVYKALH